MRETHVKNTRPQIDDSTRNLEDQAWTLVKENVAFNWSIRGYFFFLGKVIWFACLLDWFAILTCLYNYLSCMITWLFAHFSMTHSHIYQIGLWLFDIYLICMTVCCLTTLPLAWCMIACLCLPSFFIYYVFQMYPHLSLCTLDYP